MSEKKTKIEITERENGFTIEVSGKEFSEFCNCCCTPTSFMKSGNDSCCETKEKK